MAHIARVEIRQASGDVSAAAKKRGLHARTITADEHGRSRKFCRADNVVVQQQQRSWRLQSVLRLLQQW